MNGVQIGRIYGLKHSAIGRLLRGETWTHI
jgi:hypothetical protein